MVVVVSEALIDSELEDCASGAMSEVDAALVSFGMGSVGGLVLCSAVVARLV